MICRDGDVKALQEWFEEENDDKPSINVPAPMEDVEPEFRGKTPLHVAAGASHVEVLLLLLRDYHADPNVPHPVDGTMPLHVAVRLGSVQEEDISK